jgi:hypothetical protein
MKALSVIVILVLVIVYLVYRLTAPTTSVVTTPQVVVQPFVGRPERREPERREPEFRNAPYKQYKPRNFQQMGVLLGDDGVLPLYGRESPGHRDRYQYYTTTPGEQIYPLKITQGDRECTEDIGCPEFYGNEDVSVLGKDGTFKVNMYDTEQLYY